MMFVGYGAIAYPVTIVMNEALSEEYCGKRIDTFLIEILSMNLYEKNIKKLIVFNSMLTTWFKQPQHI